MYKTQFLKNYIEAIRVKLIVIKLGLLILII